MIKLDPATMPATISAYVAPTPYVPPVSDGINDIGIPGTAGFGVGICPAVPAGFAEYEGTDDPQSADYGNYYYMDNSVMVWIPAFFYRFEGSQISIRRRSYFSTVAEANNHGYTLHRAFYDGGEEQPGFFLDKYTWSKTTFNGNDIASSIKNGFVLTESASRNGYHDLTGLSWEDNCEQSSIKVAKTRGADFFPMSRFQFAAVGLLTYAHRQASTSDTHCAWYPLWEQCGNDDGWLEQPRSRDDNAVLWESDGHLGGGKAGSAGYGGGVGNVFAKSTHNGQNCGIADLSGGVWETVLGLTSRAVTKNIEGATQDNPCVMTIAGHGLLSHAVGEILADSVVGMTELNNKLYHTTVIDEDHIQLDGVDSTGYGEYVSGGQIRIGNFYALKPSVRIADMDAEDHWSDDGIAANFELIDARRFVKPNAGNTNLWGNEAAIPFQGSFQGEGWTMDGLGLCAAPAVGAGGVAPYGDNFIRLRMLDKVSIQSGGACDEGTHSGCFAICGSVDYTYGADNITGGRAGMYLPVS